MKIALLGNSVKQINRVFTVEVMSKLRSYGEVSPCIGYKDLDSNKEFLSECEIAFSTWSMPILSEAEIRNYFPNLKALFYAAGTVQSFAEPFLSCGVRIFSAAAANAVPVAEYTAAQIVLASKGYFQAAKVYRWFMPLSILRGRHSNPGNYKVKIGLFGLGAIGSMVAEKLKDIDGTVYAYDPFVKAEKAESLGVKLADPETIFRECDVISNHLANKPELKNFFNEKLFKLMKKNATFINTGRGAQVKESALAHALLFCPRRTAVIDVLKNEVFVRLSPLWWCPNAILTAHIAGSTGNEVVRMGDYMLTALDNYLVNKGSPYEVTLEKLKTIA